MRNVPIHIPWKNMLVKVKVESKELVKIMKKYEGFFENWDGDAMAIEIDGDAIRFSDCGEYCAYVEGCIEAEDIVDVLAGIFDSDYASAGYRYYGKEEYEDEEYSFEDLAPLEDLVASTQILMDHKEKIVSSMVSANIKIYEGDDDYEIQFVKEDYDEEELSSIIVDIAENIGCAMEEVTDEMFLEHVAVRTVKVSYLQGEKCKVEVGE